MCPGPRRARTRRRRTPPTTSEAREGLRHSAHLADAQGEGGRGASRVRGRRHFVRSPAAASENVARKPAVEVFIEEECVFGNVVLLAAEVPDEDIVPVVYPDGVALFQHRLIVV